MDECSLGLFCSLALAAAVREKVFLLPIEAFQRDEFQVFLRMNHRVSLTTKRLCCVTDRTVFPHVDAGRLKQPAPGSPTLPRPSTTIYEYYEPCLTAQHDANPSITRDLTSFTMITSTRKPQTQNRTNDDRCLDPSLGSRPSNVPSPITCMARDGDRCRRTFPTSPPRLAVALKIGF